MSAMHARVHPPGLPSLHAVGPGFPGPSACRQALPLVLVAHPVADLYGSDRMLLESIRGLSEAGARVVLTVPAPGPLVTEARRYGAQVRYCPTPVLRKALLSPRAAVSAALRLPGEAAAMLRLLRELRPQTVYVSTLTVPLWTVLARLAGCRVVAHVHEAEESAPLPLRVALAVPLTAAHEVLVNSRFSRDVLRRSLPLSPGGTTRAQVLPNAVSGPPDLPAPRAVLDGVLRLVYVGRLSHRKGVDVAVSALALLQERGVPAELDIVGAVFSGNEAFERGLRGLITELGVSGSVRLHGFQPEPWPYLAGADVCLVPSRQDEPFGNTAVESVLAARPAVVSDTSGLREAGGVYNSVHLVPPADAAALADALACIAGDWARWRTRAVANAADAARRHSPVRYRRRIASTVLGVQPGAPAPASPPSMALASAPFAAAPPPADPGSAVPGPAASDAILSKFSMSDPRSRHDVQA